MRERERNGGEGGRGTLAAITRFNKCVTTSSHVDMSHWWAGLGRSRGPNWYSSANFHRYFFLLVEGDSTIQVRSAWSETIDYYRVGKPPLYNFIVCFFFLLAFPLRERKVRRRRCWPERRQQQDVSVVMTTPHCLQLASFSTSLHRVLSCPAHSFNLSESLSRGSTNCSSFLSRYLPISRFLPRDSHLFASQSYRIDFHNSTSRYVSVSLWTSRPVPLNHVFFLFLSDSASFSCIFFLRLNVDPLFVESPDFSAFFFVRFRHLFCF